MQLTKSKYFCQLCVQEVWGYKRSWLRTNVCWLCIVLTLGILRLVLHWLPKYFLVFTHSPCTLAEATRVLVIVSGFRV